MADRYWFPSATTAVWATTGTTSWSASLPLQFTGSKSGTTLTTVGSPALVVGMSVRGSTGTLLGNVVSGSGDTWTLSLSSSVGSQTMCAATTGASVPTISDNVFFVQRAFNYSVQLSGTLACASLTVSGSGITLSNGATTPRILNVAGSFILPSTVIYNYSGNINFIATTAGNIITTSGKVLGNTIVFNGTGSWTLGSALTTNITGLTFTKGSFSTGNYSVTTPSFSSSNTNIRSISLGSSTVTITGTGFSLSNSTNLTFDAGTSNINITTNSSTCYTGNNTFYNITYSSFGNTHTLASENNTAYCNNLTLNNNYFYSYFSIPNSFVVSGTFTVTSATSGINRVRLSAPQITCNTTNFVDLDFFNTNITGLASPVTGVRLGDGLGNTGILFDASKTVYWSNLTAASWFSVSWATTQAGTVASENFPLPQDTAVIQNGYPSSGTITFDYSPYVKTLDASARTNGLTLTGSISLLGSFINGTGVTVTGVLPNFNGNTLQTVQSAGKTFGSVSVFCSGSVEFLDAFSCSSLTLGKGALIGGGYNVTFSSALFLNSSSLARSVDIGIGTWTFTGSGITWDASATTPTNLTVVSSSGSINLTSAASKTFRGGGIETYPTINQGGTGTLIITGSNKFTGLTNTAIGPIQFEGAKTNTFTSFNISGASGNLLQLGSSSVTQTTLKKPTAWNMGVLSTNAGNNTGLNFSSNDGTMEYLSVSYINGVNSSPKSTSNFFIFF